MSIILQLKRRCSQQACLCLSAQPLFHRTPRRISRKNAHEGGPQQPPYLYGTVGLHMFAMGTARPSEHPHQARKKAPPDMGGLDSHVLV